MCEQTTMRRTVRLAWRWRLGSKATENRIEMHMLRRKWLFVALGLVDLGLGDDAVVALQLFEDGDGPVLAIGAGGGVRFRARGRGKLGDLADSLVLLLCHFGVRDVGGGEGGGESAVVFFGDVAHEGGVACGVRC
jgi:hypothetical protein